jgi:TolB-like protein
MPGESRRHDPERSSREQLKAVFHDALECPPDERAAFLDQTCRDSELRRKVEALLAAHDAAGSFLDNADISGAHDSTRGPVLTSGSRLGPYEIVDLLGAGGMGEVYRARDTRLGRLVAVKVLHGAAAEDRDRVRRFELEARAASALNHPNIVTLHDVGTADDGGGSPFLVTELLEGATLRERLTAARPSEGDSPHEGFDLRTVLDCAIQIARGLAAAHAAGIVHRDLKPENVFITRHGVVKILDFGLAKLAVSGGPLDETATGTRAGMMLGTVGYMAPEQIRGQAVDHRADVFAFGAVLYEMLSGSRAFDAASGIDTLGAILNVEPAPLASHVPRPLVQIVKACLEKDPARRASSASDLAAALQSIADGSPPVPLPISPQPAVGRRRLVVALTLLVIVVVGAVGLWRWRVARVVPTNDAAARRVVAVLPFDNIAPDQSQQYFAAGMTEEILAQLSKVSSIRVLSRAAVANYRSTHEGLGRIDRDLGAGSLVSGSVRLGGERIRINVHLLEARSNQTIWSEEYDRELKDVFAVQSDVALRVANALQATLTSAETGRIEKPPTDNVQAYQLYLKSREYSSIDPGRNRASIVLLREAIARDPGFALAHAKLAVRLGFLGDYGDHTYFKEALTTAQKAVQLDPALGEAHHAVAASYLRFGRLSEARLSYLRAAELAPNMVAALNDLSIAEMALGHYDQSLFWARRGFQLAPNLNVAYYHVGVPLVALADDAVTERWLDEAERRFPELQRIQLLLSGLEFLRGQQNAALERIRRSVAAEPGNQEGRVGLAEMLVLVGSAEALPAVEALFRQGPEARTSNILSESFRTLYGFLLMKQGDSPQAQQLLDKSLAAAQRNLRDGSEVPELRMEIAAIHTLRGNKAEALKWIEEAYRSGWRLYREADRDPLLADLRNEPAFRDFVKRMEHDVAEMRRRIDVNDNPRLPPPNQPSGR